MTLGPSRTSDTQGLPTEAQVSNMLKNSLSGFSLCTIRRTMEFYKLARDTDNLPACGAEIERVLLDHAMEKKLANEDAPDAGEETFSKAGIHASPLADRDFEDDDSYIGLESPFDRDFEDDDSYIGWKHWICQLALCFGTCFEGK